MGLQLATARGNEVVAFSRFEEAIDTLDAMVRSNDEYVLLAHHLRELLEVERYRRDAVFSPAFAQKLRSSCLLVGVDRHDLRVHFAKEPLEAANLLAHGVSIFAMASSRADKTSSRVRSGASFHCCSESVPITSESATSARRT